MSKAGWGILLVLVRYFCPSLRQNKTNCAQYGVLAMYYKNVVPICFPVWPTFRLQIGILAEILAIWLFWPLRGVFFGSRELFSPL